MPRGITIGQLHIISATSLSWCIKQYHNGSTKSRKTNVFFVLRFINRLFVLFSPFDRILRLGKKCMYIKLKLQGWQRTAFFGRVRIQLGVYNQELWRIDKEQKSWRELVVWKHQCHRKSKDKGLKPRKTKLCIQTIKSPAPAHRPQYPNTSHTTITSSQKSSW